MIRKGRTKEELYAVMADFADMFKVLDMTEYQLHNALQIVATDFEDVLQFACAKCHGCDVIVTRNVRHFSFADIPVMTPKEFLNHKDIGF